MTEIERIKLLMANNPDLDELFCRYQNGNCSKRFLCQELAKTIEQYVIKARIEELENFFKGKHIDNNAVYLGHKYIEHIAELRKQVKKDELKDIGQDYYDNQWK